MAGTLGKKAGFTLIELLVVVGIIAVLLGLLLPNLRAARETAKAMACGSNLKAYGQLCLLYAQDNCDVPPPTGLVMNVSYPNGTTVNGAFDPHELLQATGYIYMPVSSSMTQVAYGKSIFICPNADTSTAADGVNHLGNLTSRICPASLYPTNNHGRWGNIGMVPSSASATSVGWLSSSYGVNANSGMQTYPFTYLWTQSLAAAKTISFTRPAETVFLLDGALSVNLFNYGDGGISFRHNDMTSCNVLFLDNHVESVTSNISGIQTNKRFPIPNCADVAGLGKPNSASTLIWCQ